MRKNIMNNDRVEILSFSQQLSFESTAAVLA